MFHVPGGGFHLLALLEDGLGLKRNQKLEKPGELFQRGLVPQCATFEFFGLL